MKFKNCTYFHFKKMSCNDNVSTLIITNKADYVLLKIAINFAELGLRTWFISVCPFEKLPENISSPCKEALQLISFIYLKDYVDLLKHLNGIHKWKNLPDFIIVKNFETYCNLNNADYYSTKSAFLCATLVDCMNFLAKKREEKANLLICCSHDNLNFLQEKIKPLYDMYFKYVVMENNFKSEDDFIASIKEKYL